MTSIVPFNDSHSIRIAPSWTIQHALIRWRYLSSKKATIAPSDQTAIPKGDNLSYQNAMDERNAQRAGEQHDENLVCSRPVWG